MKALRATQKTALAFQECGPVLTRLIFGSYKESEVELTLNFAAETSRRENRPVPAV
jgi:hypothetical protein